ncbi:hypothetical protein H4Q26_015844 [Puccinia striiformis f. sp. tritici PST-130]|nr:hypothetical protein H4Q26_015844 [Puccinia striiformis f. sp. tritici PST-130]
MVSGTFGLDSAHVIASFSSGPRTGTGRLQDSWNDGRIQFAFVRVKEAGSGLTNYHVQINARCDADVEPSHILKRVADSSGAKYSVHNEKPVKERCTCDDFEPTIKATFTPPQPAIPARPPPAQAPAPPKSTQENENEGRPGYVGTAYTPVSLGKPGKLGNRLSAFSTPQEVNQPFRPRSGKKMTWAERQALAKNVAAEEEARSRAALKGVTLRATGSFGWHEGCCSSCSILSSAPSEDDFDAPAPRASESENEDFEPKSSVGTDCGRFPTAAASTASSASTPPDEQSGDPVQSVAHAEEALHQKMNNLALEPDPVAASTSGSDLKAVVIYDYEQADTDEMGLVEGETIINIEQVDEGWWTGMSADGTRQGLFPATCVRLITEETEANQAEAIAPEAEEEVVEEEEVTATSTPAADKGVHAIAMYDYEAGEDNEITFQETEEIIEIEYSSEDWWTGTVASSGQRGLFPANYVELQEQ